MLAPNLKCALCSFAHRTPVGSRLFSCSCRFRPREAVRLKDLTVVQRFCAEFGLSFLGCGVQLPIATWGTMLRNAQSEMTTAPWVAIFPGLMIFIVVIAMNTSGDGLRDALDPRHFKGEK